MVLSNGSAPLHEDTERRSQGHNREYVSSVQIGYRARAVSTIYGVAKLKTIKRENMNVLSNDSAKVLVEEMGWTLERAEGYVEGERYRLGRLALSEYHKVGIDEYALGFRAGYFRRDDAASESRIRIVSPAP